MKNHGSYYKQEIDTMDNKMEEERGEGIFETFLGGMSALKKN